MTMSESETITRIVIAENLLVTLPHWVSVRIPQELVRMNQSSRCDRTNNNPRKKSIRRRTAQVTSGLPTSAAGVIESRFRVLWQWVWTFWLRTSKVKRHHNADSRIDGRCHRGGISAPSDAAQDGDTSGVDMRLAE